jgi:hypothetical protein
MELALVQWIMRAARYMSTTGRFKVVIARGLPQIH